MLAESDALRTRRSLLPSCPVPDCTRLP